MGVNIKLLNLAHLILNTPFFKKVICSKVGQVILDSLLILSRKQTVKRGVPPHYLTSLIFIKEDSTKVPTKLQREYWQQYPKPLGSLKIIHRGNMFLLDELKQIVDRLGITFWLHGGSLIGALRHNGFIPWDDDVDVGMFREDFDKLVEYLRHDSEFKIRAAYHDDLNFSIGYQFKTKDDGFCCFIDIFLFDYFPHNPSVFDELFSKQRKMMVDDFINLKNKPDPDYYSRHFAVFDSERDEAIGSIVRNHLESISYSGVSDYVYYSIENYPFPYPLMRKEEILPGIKVQFEHLTLTAPANCQKYLCGYGDYWSPPNDMGVSPHIGYYLPHIEYIDEYLKGRGYNE